MPSVLSSLRTYYIKGQYLRKVSANLNLPVPLLYINIRSLSKTLLFSLGFMCEPPNNLWVHLRNCNEVTCPIIIQILICLDTGDVTILYRSSQAVEFVEFRNSVPDIEIGSCRSYHFKQRRAIAPQNSWQSPLLKSRRCKFQKPL